MDELSSDLLRENWLWESPEGGSSTWTPSDYAARAKLAFLVHLYSEYGTAPGLSRTFSGGVSLTLFDNFWEIEQLELAGNVNESSGRLLERKEVSFTGNENVDAWLESRVKP